MKIDISRYEDEDNVFYVPVPREWIADIVEHPVIKFMALQMAARWFADQDEDMDFDYIAEHTRKIHNGEYEIPTLDTADTKWHLMRQFDALARFLMIYIKKRELSKIRSEAGKKGGAPIGNRNAAKK